MEEEVHGGQQWGRGWGFLALQTLTDLEALGSPTLLGSYGSLSTQV